MNSYQDAKAAVDEILTMLDNLSSLAAESLREGLEATLTLHRLDIPPAVRVSLYSTNPIENVFSSVASQVGRIHNWKSVRAWRWRWASCSTPSSASTASRAVRRWRFWPMHWPVLISKL